MDDHLDQILEAWRTNNRINLLLIDHIAEDGLHCTLSKRGGRSVLRQFTHLHNNRVWHLERRARNLSRGLYKFETKEEPERSALKEHLVDSAGRIETYFRQLVEGVPGLKCFKKGAISYLCYFVSHEAHHRGNIILTLKQSGHPLDKDVRYAIWDWDRR
jgi:uncharacterized damage-inducible protein DinB